MSKTLQHRGPDGDGIYISERVGLAHRRLSIIDLSEAASQPMSSFAGRYWIVFNGEIYNYLELKDILRSKGFSFSSTSDTEVLLNLYLDKGLDLFEQLNGMFAFAIWDEQEKKLLLARDRLGIKPLYWTQTGDSFYFSSEIKALFQVPEIKARLDEDALHDYLTFQFCLGEKTLFRNIHKLDPGSYMLIDRSGTMSQHSYWNLTFDVDASRTEDMYREELEALLQDSIKLRLRSDVPVGAHLSGGIDSSIVTSLAAKQSNNSFHTFSGGFKDNGGQFDETRFARLVSANADTVHHEIFPKPQDFVDQLPLIIYHMDEPTAGPGIFPQLMVAKEAKKHVSVVLGGQGGDELFAGYARYLIAYLEECIKGGIEGTQEDPQYIVQFQSLLPNLPQLANYKPLIRHFWKKGVFGSHADRYFRLIDRSNGLRDSFNYSMFDIGYDPLTAYDEIFNKPALGSYINKMTRFDIKTLLPALLHVEDRTSLMVSLESRVPLLDHRIVEFAAKLPPRLKFSNGRSKYLLREASKKMLPGEIVEREDKMGFPVPLNIWYQQEPVHSFVRDTLLSKRSKERGWIHPRSVETLLNGEKAFGRTLWGLLCLELWAQAFLDV